MRSTDLILYGGAEIDSGFLTQLDQEWAGTVRHIYGTTETMCSLYHPDPVGQHRRLRPGFYSRTRIIRIGGDTNEVVAPGEEGELIVDAAGDAVFTEYLNRPEATAEKVRDGWYYTGDICLLHDNGDVDLIGRTDDVIRSGGENIHPGDIEAILLSHPGVKEVAVIGTPDNKWGEVVTACVAGENLLAVDLGRAFRQVGWPRSNAPAAICSWIVCLETRPIRFSGDALKALPKHLCFKISKAQIFATSCVILLPYIGRARP